MMQFHSRRLKRYICVEMNEEKAITRVEFAVSPVGEKSGDSSRIIVDLKEYLNGEKVDFSHHRVDLSRLTPFERSTLLEARKIPYGEAVSYSELARRAGTSSARAAGNALAKNPVPIIIPCHRILRRDRKIGGYSAGVEIKKKLLEIEGVRFNSKCDY